MLLNMLKINFKYFPSSPLAKVQQNSVFTRKCSLLNLGSKVSTPFGIGTVKRSPQQERSHVFLLAQG